MIRYSLPVKFIAVILTAVALIVCLGSAIGIVQLVNAGLYTDTINDFLYNRLEFQAYELAESLTERYAVTQLSNCSTEALKELGYRHVFEDVLSWSGFNEQTFSYTVSTQAEGVVDSAMHGPGEGLAFETVCSSRYPVLVMDEAVIDELYGKDYLKEETLELDSYDLPVTIRYYASPKCTVIVTLIQDAALNRFGTAVPLVEMLYEFRYTLIATLALSLLLFSTGIVYICVAAGRKNKNTPIVPHGLNGLPLDLYFTVAAGVCLMLLPQGIDMAYDWAETNKNFNPGTISLGALLFLGPTVMLLGAFYATVTQIKMDGHFWFENCLLVRLGKLLWRWIKQLLYVLPSTWSYLILGILLFGSILSTVPFVMRGVLWPMLLVLGLCAVVLIYNAYAYGTLTRGAERMAKGNLNRKINTRFLVGSYARCAEDLNALADVAVVAARKQMKADRMKTELITNVSHDIKTPLTSIINYVDLLSKASTAADRSQYLEVLGRQSQRLKKLIEDLVEMSKATTGNLSVDLRIMDGAEAMTQALGEFADKLTAAELTVVFQPPREPIRMQADGRLAWRVMSNLLSNVVKYALPGTRVYAQVERQGEEVLLSLKNISREPLNISTDELTERFVRGDDSRNTEGSGLGLNIAKSLMEVQHGQLRLNVDADLFHATAVFPAAPSETEE